MKTSLATTLSVVGVLAAGSVAFAVNTSVLDSADQTPTASQALEATITDLATAEATAEATPVTGQSVNTVAPPVTVASATGVQTSYNIDGVAVVTLSREGESLSVVSVTPVSGYTYTALNESISRIEIRFTKGSSVLKFHADIIGDRVVTSVMNEPQLSGAPTRPHSHDEEHDEDHDEEHGDGEHDDD